ncbi:hypothetical protein [Thiogranum longum]|jgi:hypothetical protein
MADALLSLKQVPDGIPGSRVDAACGIAGSGFGSGILDVCRDGLLSARNFKINNPESKQNNMQPSA